MKTNETTETTKNLATAAMRIVVVGANKYLTQNNLKADETAFAECCKSWLKIKLPEALHDAKEAMDCHMEKIAEATFTATMIQAGIEAAKECGFPPHMLV